MNVKWADFDGATLVLDPNTNTYHAYIQVTIQGHEAEKRGGHTRLSDWKRLFAGDLKSEVLKLLEQA